MEKCMRCNHDLIIEGNFMVSEVTGQDLTDEDDAMITTCHCPHCGAHYEITDTPISERIEYPYWSENET